MDGARAPKAFICAPLGKATQAWGQGLEQETQTEVPNTVDNNVKCKNLDANCVDAQQMCNKE